MISTSELRAQFRDRFKGEPRIFSAPGRVNLIGEHTDYNDGFVLPMAIDRRTYVAAQARSDRRVRAVSTLFPDQVEFEIDPHLSPAADWANHVRGMAACFEREQYRLRGVDLLIASDVPLGAGLSSSAALEVAIGWALLALADQPIDLEDLAFTAQRAEQEFTGTRCGIMDQYIACYGVVGHALLIDCRNLEYRAVPLDFDASRIVVCDSLVKHELASGEYNRRRAECEEGVRLLSAALPGIAALRDVSVQDFERYEDLLPEVIGRRCRHVISEDARTLRAADALERGDRASFGRLMYESHASLRDDYEVSCRELDALVESAARVPGVDGARMTGGGFGGSTVNLVASDHLDQFEATLARDYEREFGRAPAFHLCQAEGGARED